MALSVDTLRGRNEYLVYPKELETFPGGRTRVIELLKSSNCDSLLGHKVFFVYLGICDVIGIKEQDALHLICLDAKGRHEDHFFLWKDAELEGFFEPIPIQTVERKPDSIPLYYYSYFIRFKEDGHFDVEFDSRVRFLSDNKYSSTPFNEELSFISPTLVNFLVETAIKESLKRWNYEYTMIDRQICQDKRIEWWSRDNHDFGIITDMVTNNSDTLVWSRKGENAKKDFSVIIDGKGLIIPMEQWFYHSGSSSIISIDQHATVDKTEDLQPYLSISFRRKRLFTKEMIRVDTIKNL